jgi:hypothetical protein
MMAAMPCRTPVANPYLVGAPVPSARLAGRQALFAQIEAVWATPGPRDTLVIFGLRRTGKTSLVRAIPQACRLGDDTRVACLTLQGVDRTEGLSDLCYAIAFALWEADPERMDEPAPEDYESHPLAMLLLRLLRLESSMPPRRYILLLDESELLEAELPEADRTALLRGLTQQPIWLALGLVGLHNLKEGSASLREALGRWRPLLVGLLDREAFADLLAVKDDAFPLEYSLDALDRAYELTGGQPFLGQLLGEGLVQRFNQPLKPSLDPPAPTFTAADVNAVVEDPCFDANGYVYFNGSWAQAGEAPPGQQALLKILAEHRNSLDQNVWCEQSRLNPAAFEAAVEALERHDVVSGEKGVCRYRVELMCRWVAVGATGQ